MKIRKQLMTGLLIVALMIGIFPSNTYAYNSTTTNLRYITDYCMVEIDRLGDLTINVYGNEGDVGCFCYLSGDYSSGRVYYDGNTCTITVYKKDLQKLKDGIYEIYIWKAKNGITTDIIGCFELQIQEGQASLFSAYGATYENFTNNLVANNLYRFYCFSSLNEIKGSYFSEIRAKAMEVTAGLYDQREKVKAIHDYICSEYAYAYDVVNDYGAVRKGQESFESWMFLNKRGVCTDFSALTRVMLTSIGIPCITVIGYAHSYNHNSLEDGMENLTSEDFNHEWNMYYDFESNHWYSMDVTWDCKNMYYGENDARNVMNKAPAQQYLRMSDESIGRNHIPFQISPYTTNVGVKGIVARVVGANVYNEQEKCYEVYQNATGFSINGSFLLLDDTFVASDNSGFTVTPYDLSVLGKQEVTLSYPLLNVSCQVKLKVVEAPKEETEDMEDDDASYSTYINKRILSASDYAELKMLKESYQYGYWEFDSAPMTKITKAKSKKKSVKISLKQVSCNPTYEVRYSTKKNMKGAKKCQTTSTSTEIVGLRKNKKYYFQTRCIWKVGYQMYVVSNWSKVKAIKTKKK